MGLRTLLALLWLTWPAWLLVQALAGLIRRGRLLSDPMPVTGVVTEVLPGGEAQTCEKAEVVDLRLRYEVGGRTYRHVVTRMDHQRAGYAAGSEIGLVCEQGNPANVVDAAKRPWDDVIGPTVLSVLLAFFMAWAWQVFIGF